MIWGLKSIETAPRKLRNYQLARTVVAVVPRQSKRSTEDVKLASQTLNIVCSTNMAQSPSAELSFITLYRTRFAGLVL